MHVLVVRHHTEDSAGFIASAFEAHGASLDVRLFPDEGPLPDPAGYDHIVVLGAESSVNDGDPWIAAELQWLRRAGESTTPVLGICFGAQILCAASGGGVERAPRREIGWFTVQTADASAIPAGPWLEFHSDRCVPPDGSQVLAWNDLCPQAYSIGPHLGVQFHPEVDGPQLKRWLDAGADAALVAEGIDDGEFIAATIREEPAARDRASLLVAFALQLASSKRGRESM